MINICNCIERLCYTIYLYLIKVSASQKSILHLIDADITMFLSSNKDMDLAVLEIAAIFEFIVNEFSVCE